MELDADVRIISKPIFFPSHKFKLIYLVPCDRDDPVSNLGDEQTMTTFTNLRMGVFTRKCLSLIQGTPTKEVVGQYSLPHLLSGDQGDVY